jgi:hypothetical protein
MRARIVTQLDRNAVFSSLGDLVAERDLMDPRSRLKGQLRPPELSVAYQTSMAVAPRIRIAAFLGRVVSGREGLVIEGTVEASVLTWLVTASLVLVSVVSLGRAAIERDYVQLLSVCVVGAAILTAWSWYVRSTKQFIVSEICRASRGSVV